MSMNEQLFVTSDRSSVRPARDFVGYGEHPPVIRWEGEAKVAVQIVVNYEEGSEKSFPMGDEENDFLGELPIVTVGKRDMSLEGEYEYGSRAGMWRLFRIFDAAGVPVTFFATAVALERNPAVAEKLAARGDEPAGHGYRWTSALDMTRDEEREAIRRAVESIERTTGTRPRGWFSRKMGPNSRELVVEEGGFEYDAETFNDDLPHWVIVHDKPHLVVPYTTVLNDVRFVLAQGYASPEHFLEYACAGLNRLRDDGDDVARMMSIGLHPRIMGNPARADALARFIEYAQTFDDVWIARRIDIARSFREQYPAERALAGSADAAELSG
jgi:peptidoglycan/xylan/chitin deacetylase (PgdA/CDA1 family)